LLRSNTSSISSRVLDALRLRPLRSTSLAAATADGGSATAAVSCALSPLALPPNPLLTEETVMPPLPVRSWS
jgi:hypothetical protein